MKQADGDENKVAPKKTEDVKEVPDEESGASINEVSSLLSTQKIERAIQKAVEEEVQDADTEDEA